VPENVKSEVQVVQETLSDATSATTIASEGRTVSTVGAEATAETRAS